MSTEPTVVARWQLRLLGGLRLSDGQQHITHWPTRAAALLLARLALWPARDHAREALVELLWPGVALDVGRNRLRQTLSSLRKLLESPGQPPVIDADRQALRLVPGALDCDVQRFEQLLRSGQAAQALRCYGGELMPGHYDDWVDQERLRLAALAERAVESGPSGPGLVRAATPAVAMPLQAGRDTGPVAAGVALPSYLTRYFGGDPQAARLRGRVLAHRLVTLAGPGGSGKTRLAVEVAQSLRHSAGWPGSAEGAAASTGAFDEMAFVSLVGCSSAPQVVGAIAAALRLATGGPGSAEARLLGALGGRRLLLVLDNFEQLIGQAEPLVADLLAQLPRLHLLVTSRRLLGVDGEQCCFIDALPLPADDATLEALAANPAVALFVDRARAARADFQLGARNRADIADLVRVLEGMPLAIELAAARIRAYAPREMLQVLRPAMPGASDASATPALDLLARGGPRAGLDARHASMQAAIAWSWQLLAPEARALLGGLTVFRGGFSAAAVRAVAGGDAAHRQLDELLAHSLVQGRGLAGPDGVPDDEAGRRFHLAEPIREFAAAQGAPGDSAFWRARHAAWLADWALGLPTTPDLLAVRAELPNIEALLAAAAADDAALVECAVQVLLRLRRVLEDVELPASALASAEVVVAACADAPLRARAQSLLGPLLLMAGRGEAALALAEAGLAATPASAGASPRGRALHALGRVRWRRQREAAGVLPLLDEAEPLALAAADVELQAGLLALRAFIVNGAFGDHAAAYALHARALALWQQLGNRHAVHSGLYNLAVTEQQAGRHAATLALLVPLRESARALHDWRRLSQADNVAGNALSELRRWPEAVQALRDALRLAWRSRAPYEMAYPLWNLPRALAHRRQPEAALRLAAFAAAYWQASFGALTAADQHDLRRVRRLVACQLDARRCQALWAEGAALDLPQALALALASPIP